MLVLISYSSKITEKKTWHSPKTSPYFGLTSFLSWKINRKNLQRAQSNCIKFCQKGARNGLSNIQQTYSTKISTKTNVNSDILKSQPDSSCLKATFFDLVASKRDFSLLCKNWHIKVKDIDMLARSPEQDHLKHIERSQQNACTVWNVTVFVGGACTPLAAYTACNCTRTLIMKLNF